MINEPTPEQLAAVGYFDEGWITRRNATNPGHMPDNIIEGRVFDHYAPTFDTADQLFQRLEKKVPDQTTRVVLDLANTDMTATQILDALSDPGFTVFPLDQLQEIIIMENGEISGIWARQ